MRSFIDDLTSPWNKDYQIHKQLEVFAESLGWYPSDVIEDSTNEFITGHIFVEHGLENSAVISFINKDFRFRNLSSNQQKDLLKISYNNLVDLHISVDYDYINGMHNRLTNKPLFYTDIINGSVDNLKSDFFENLLREKNIIPNIKSLDDALIETISHWKRVLSAELNNAISNRQLSNLFNTIIFSRAIEDHYKRKNFDSSDSDLALLALLHQSPRLSISDTFFQTLNRYGINKYPDFISDKDSLECFNTVARDTIHNLFNDFYFNKYAPYRYDFSIISKHALSRIYERYVSILRVNSTEQLSFWGGPIPQEEKKKSSGTYYTPQFVARFFARFIENFKPELKYSAFSVLEPAVGSGIFLRTVLERKAEILGNNNLDEIQKSFELVEGVDINPTACDAAKLSLTLLHLVVTDQLPNKPLNIFEANSLDYFQHLDGFSNSKDVIIANPPYVAYNNLNDVERIQIRDLLGDLAFGRPDLYLPFLKIAIDGLKPGGLGLFIIPNTFMTSDSAKGLRRYLLEHTFIRCIVDLTEINVFEESVYTILLIFEKVDTEYRRKRKAYGSEPLSIVAKIQDNVGEGLQKLLSGNRVVTNSYAIYEVNQSFYDSNQWYLLPPMEFDLKSKLERFPKVKDLLEVRTGFSSGASEVFIQKINDIAKEEQSAFIPFLDDRDISAYKHLKTTDQYLFYPFEGDNQISEETLLTKYPIYYRKLLGSKTKLEKRSEVKAGKIPWWYPNRPRAPKFMMVPKIVTPHLVYTPKFTVDIEGRFAVSRSPFITLREKSEDQQDVLYYYMAIFNSSVCFWYLLNHAPKYQHGYAMLEPKYLKDLPVPSHKEIDKLKLKKIISLGKEMILGDLAASLGVEKKLEKLIAEIYGLSTEENLFLGLE